VALVVALVLGLSCSVSTLTRVIPDPSHFVLMILHIVVQAMFLSKNERPGV
jgi:hypothetical protein